MKVLRHAYLCGFLCLAATAAMASELPWDEGFTPPPGKYSWIQLDTGEWLKGDLVAIYDDKLAFDSDHFDNLTLDMEDVEAIHGRGIFVVSKATDRADGGFMQMRPVSGFLQVRGEQVIVISGDNRYEFNREELVSVTQLAQLERDRWRGDVKLGLNVREGNTDIWEYSIGTKLLRRTPVSRWTLDYKGYKNETDGERIEDSHRLTLAADRFTGRRLYWRPISAQYFKDRLQNIEHQATLDTGIGYHLIDTSRTSWDLQAGVGGNYLESVSVEPGEKNGEWSPVGTLGMDLDIEVTSWLDYELEIDMWFLDESAGKYQHHIVSTLSTDLFGNLDLDISMEWNHTENPQAPEGGPAPEQDDYRLQVGLSYEF
jgi:putative salt-induced outer membrane protein YdiY